MNLAPLQALVQSWGGDLKQVESDDPLWDHIAAAPFSSWLGVDHKRKVIYYTKEAQPGEVIHEAGHVFASSRTPNFSEEYDFFGWEFVVAVKVGLVDEWLETTGNYTIGGTDFVEFEDMTIDEQSDLLEERVQHARSLGLIQGDEPMSIR